MARPGTDPGSEDLTRKQRREQARSQRKALEEAEAAKAVRRKRLMQLGGALAVVAVIIIVIAIATSGKGSSKPSTSPNSSANAQAVSEVTTLLNGIHQSGNTLGNPNAPYTLQYFGDLECPICKEFTLQTLPTVVARYVRTGKMKIEYRSLQTATREPETFRTQQVAALAAGKQNLMWYYVELFYHEQGEEESGYVTEQYLQGLAQQVPGLNLSKWTTARNDPALAEQVTTDAQAAAAAGFTGTPSFMVARAGAKPQVFSPPTFSEPNAFTEALDKIVH